MGGRDGPSEVSVRDPGEEGLGLQLLGSLAWGLAGRASVFPPAQWRLCLDATVPIPTLVVPPFRPPAAAEPRGGPKPREVSGGRMGEAQA